jgi:hypothetical protein
VENNLSKNINILVAKSSRFPAIGAALVAFWRVESFEPALTSVKVHASQRREALCSLP